MQTCVGLLFVMWCAAPPAAAPTGEAAFCRTYQVVRWRPSYHPDDIRAIKSNNAMYRALNCHKRARP